MIKLWARIFLALMFSILALAPAPAYAQTGPARASTVTVVVELTLKANNLPQQALMPLSDLRSLMRKQPGFLSDELLQNLNAGNAPQYVHVSRWASIAYWAAMFSKAEFSQFSEHGTEHYTILVSAFQPGE